MDVRHEMSQQQNIDTKRRDKLVQYRQLAFETRERRPGYTATIVPVIIGALGDGMKKTINELTKLLAKQDLVVKTAAKIQKTILMESKIILRKCFPDSSKVTQKRTELFPECNAVILRPWKIP